MLPGWLVGLNAFSVFSSYIGTKTHVDLQHRQSGIDKILIAIFVINLLVILIHIIDIVHISKKYQKRCALSIHFMSHISWSYTYSERVNVCRTAAVLFSWHYHIIGLLKNNDDTHMNLSITGTRRLLEVMSWSMSIVYYLETTVLLQQRSSYLPLV